MKSEELERSLRSEFESYLQDTLAEVRQEITKLEESVFAEIERQRNQLEEFFKLTKSKIPEQKELDAVIRDSILEHLRLARDEGAQIAAMAQAEAEELERQRRKAEPTFADLSQAIKEISSKTTQAEILSALISNAEKFSACGGLFVVKSERLIGWHAFGEDKQKREELVRSLILPVNSQNLLSEALNSLTSIQVENGNYAGDLTPLQKAGFATSHKMIAIPLIVRGRGVAVLYAEESSDKRLFSEALESLVSVTSMTVEILAAMKSAAKKAQEEQAKEKQPVPPSLSAVAQQPVVPPSPSVIAQQPIAPQFKVEAPPTVSYQPEVTSYEAKAPVTEYEVKEPEDAPSTYTPVAEAKIEPSVKEISVETRIEVEPSLKSPEPDFRGELTQRIEATDFTQRIEVTQEATTQYDPSIQPYSVEPEVVEEYKAEIKVEPVTPHFEKPSEVGLERGYEPPSIAEQPKVADVVKPEENKGFSGELKTPLIEVERSFSPPISQLDTAKPKSLADRHIELPVDVTTEEERRYHNEARRFARLLVSEIKLYNQQKVEEGRKAGDLYDRLKEAIDRSREMYDKRVKPSVAAKFDYFHYELVHSLAEGDASKLGENYPGPKV
ncbi:MAG: hypothetical protein D6735_06330 [Acidobacteria bacterium]|nr:MAG: hypothetical protein D6735_06330 [Acidobacteriota bacterium]